MQDSASSNRSRRECTCCTGHYPKGPRLTICVVEGSLDPTFAIRSGQQEPDFRNETRQSVEIGTTMPITHGHYMETVVQMTPESPTHLAWPGYTHGLWTQEVQPFQVDAYGYALHQPAGFDGVSPTAQGLNGYVSTHKTLPEFGSPEGFFRRCAIYRGGPAHLTKNISPASSRVSQVIRTSLQRFVIVHSAKRPGIDTMSPRTNFQVNTHQSIRLIFDRQLEPIEMSPAILPGDTPLFYTLSPQLYGDHLEPEGLVNHETPAHPMGIDTHGKKKNLTSLSKYLDTDH